MTESDYRFWEDCETLKGRPPPREGEVRPIPGICIMCPPGVVHYGGVVKHERTFLCAKHFQQQTGDQNVS